MVLWPTARLELIPPRNDARCAVLVTGVSCVAVDETTTLAAALNRGSDEAIRLPDAEHMIDDLDRVMTAFGTISIKTPDVWGQDRLAKFRSEYESQMSGWLKQSFKSDINAAVRHSESEATRLSLGPTQSSSRRDLPPQPRTPRPQPPRPQPRCRIRRPWNHDQGRPHSFRTRTFPPARPRRRRWHSSRRSCWTSTPII